MAQAELLQDSLDTARGHVMSDPYVMRAAEAITLEPAQRRGYARMHQEGPRVTEPHNAYASSSITNSPFLPTSYLPLTTYSPFSRSPPHPQLRPLIVTDRCLSAAFNTSAWSIDLSPYYKKREPQSEVRKLVDHVRAFGTHLQEKNHETAPVQRASTCLAVVLTPSLAHSPRCAHKIEQSRMLILVFQQPFHVFQQPLHVFQQPFHVFQQPFHVFQQPFHVFQQPFHVCLCAFSLTIIDEGHGGSLAMLAQASFSSGVVNGFTSLPR
ncbi:hypothetical protein B0O80DRAFT_486739 [Mortierella sp. GBAus27b]|nr:hypothetical protein B0O80DRAFT_486739 [Mortierella sp. GBAus27b]